MSQMKSFVLFSFFLLSISPIQGQEQEKDNDAIVTNSFWDNWYGQFGVDLNLLFPAGHNLKKVFPKGQSLGINIAAGKWFSPVIGGRLKVNWGNGILNNPNNTWLAPYAETPFPELNQRNAGQNHRNGGFITFIGDININLHNLFGEYRPDRKWNLIVAPRAGGWIHFTSNEGAPVLGVGIINTYRLTDRWRVFADVGYHFISSVNNVASGTGHNSNAYAEINVGIEMDLSRNNVFHKASDAAEDIYDKATVQNTFWDNWFIQAGAGMSLLNPYSTNIKNVFPNGNSLGINLALGKWFTPQVGLRGGMNWQNGILMNHHAYYLERSEDYYMERGDSTMNHHRMSHKGYLALYADVFLNLHNIIAGYDASRRWNAIIYPRMGLAWNFSSTYKECPLLGFGMEHTYRLNDRLKLFADVAYQVTTSGFLDKKFFTGATGTNGWFDINLGVQYEIGNHKWKKAK